MKAAVASVFASRPCPFQPVGQRRLRPVLPKVEQSKPQNSAKFYLRTR